MLRVLLLRRRFVVGLERAEEGVQAEEQRGRVRMLPMLREELRRHACLRLGAQDLLAWNPSVGMHQAQPAREDVVGERRVPSAHDELMKPLIPQEAAREKGARRHHRQQSGRRRARGRERVRSTKRRGRRDRRGAIKESDRPEERGEGVCREPELASPEGRAPQRRCRHGLRLNAGCL